MNDIFAPIPAEVDKVSPASSPTGQALRFLLRRYPVWPIVDFLSKKTVPKHKHSIWYTMGGLALFFFAVQLITGILLMIYYQPSQPWGSVQKIVNEVPFGNVIRSIHHWSANLMVFTLFVHMFSAFFMKAYRMPREFTWLTGAGLFGLTLLFGFSGYLLPWDELSFFATRVGINEMEKAPIVGPFIAELVLGGTDVSIATIGRMYALHVVVLPLVVLSLIGLHLLFVQIQGMSEPDSFRALPPEKKKYEKFFFDYLLSEVPLWFAAFAILILLSTVLPRALGPEADPTGAAPIGIKPEWYFLSQYQALKLVPASMELLGVLAMGLAPLAIAIVPFIDREIPSRRIGRLVTLAGVGALLGLVVFTIWGWLS